MTAEVIPWPGVTRLDIAPERVLEQAEGADLTGVVILGYRADGREYFSSSFAAGPEVVWLLERAKRRLLGIPEELSGED